jgi:hypothetical protein
LPPAGYFTFLKWTDIQNNLWPSNITTQPNFWEKIVTGFVFCILLPLGYLNWSVYKTVGAIKLLTPKALQDAGQWMRPY